MPEQKGGKKRRAQKPDGQTLPPHTVIDQPVGEVFSGKPAIQSPTTESGLPVEEQVRKEWNPRKKGGLPIFLANRWRTGPQ